MRWVPRCMPDGGGPVATALPRSDVKTSAWRTPEFRQGRAHARAERREKGRRVGGGEGAGARRRAHRGGRALATERAHGRLRRARHGRRN